MLSDLNQNYERQILIEIYLQLYLSTFLHVTTLKIYQTGCITGMKKKKDIWLSGLFNVWQNCVKVTTSWVFGGVLGVS